MLVYFLRSGLFQRGWVQTNPQAKCKKIASEIYPPEKSLLRDVAKIPHKNIYKNMKFVKFLRGTLSAGEFHLWEEIIKNSVPKCSHTSAIPVVENPFARYYSPYCLSMHLKALPCNNATISCSLVLKIIGIFQQKRNKITL